MTCKSDDFPADENPADEVDDKIVVDRVQDLTWALLDECATEEDVALLDNLLLSDASARQSYIACIQLHTDLMGHYAKPTAPATPSGKLPVLGFLGQEMPVSFPSAEELK